MRANAGWKHSPEARAKMSVACKGRKLSPAHRAKISAAISGKKHSPEACAKMSEAKKGNKYNLGKKRLPETCAKIGAAHKGNKYSLGRKCSPETRAKIGAAIRDARASEARTGMRRFNLDRNQEPIVIALRAAGAAVASLANVGWGVPDLLVGFRGELFLLEVKNPLTSYGRKGLNVMQEKFKARGWPVTIVRSQEEALRIIGAIR